MPKTVYPTQMVYVERDKKEVWREERTRRDEQSAWVNAGSTRISGPEYSKSSRNFADESVVYPTTLVTNSWTSWQVFGNQNQQFRNKTITTKRRTTLFKFDTSAFKAGKPVLLNLYASDGGSTDAAIDLYKITEDWDESTVTYANQPAMTKLLNKKPLPLNQWVQIDVQDLVGGFGIAICDDAAAIPDKQKTLPKTGEYRPYLSKAGNPCWRVQTADGLKDTITYVQTANGLKEAAVYEQTANGLKEGS